MEWMKTRLLERTNIFEYYPEAKSIIIITQNYYTGKVDLDNNIGKISNYAWGDDYHLIIKKKLTGREPRKLNSASILIYKIILLMFVPVDHKTAFDSKTLVSWKDV